MNCVTGFESFHYKTGRSIPKNTNLEQKIRRILDALSPNSTASDRRWAKQKGEQCLEPTLSERLQDLIISLPVALDPQEIKMFSERCAKLRNDISHYGGPRSSAENYQKFTLEIHLKYRALEILYHALLLNEIGVDPNLIQSAMYNSFVGGRIKYELQAAGLNLSCPLPLSLTKTPA